MSSRRSLSSKSLAGIGAFLLLGGLAGRAAADEERLTLTPSLQVNQNFEKTKIGDAKRPDDLPDNVAFRAASGERQNDSLFELTPAFRARAERPGTRFDLDFSTRIRGRSARTTASDLNALDETGRFALSQQFTPRFVAIAKGSFRNREGRNPLERDDDERLETQNDRPDTRELDGDLSLAYSVTARSQLSLAYTASSRGFSDKDPLSTGNRDVDANTYTLGLSTSMTPLDRLGISLSYQQLRFGKANARLLNTQVARIEGQDDTIAAAFASWTHQFTPMWSGDMTLGVRRLESDGSGFRGLESPLGDGSLEDESTGLIGGLSFTRETEWNRTRFGYRRETRPSGGIGTSLDVDSFELLFTQRLMRNLSVGLRGDYQIAKSASEGLVPTAAFIFNGQAVCRFSSEIMATLDTGEGPVPTCVQETSSSVDTTVLRIGADLSWRWTRGFVTFLSYDFRTQDIEGTIGGRDRRSNRVRLGFTYAYDYEVY